MRGSEIQHILTSAGVRSVEACEIFRVSRGTLNRWVKDDAVPKQQIVYDIACKWAHLIELAVKANLLPLNSDIRGDARMPAIRAVLKQVTPKTSPYRGEPVGSEGKT